MVIGGLQPVTLLDYPQKIAAIVFVSGCNMRCSFCHNPNLVLPELIDKSPHFPLADVIGFFRKRKKYLDGVVITGGEPLMQRGLIAFCRRLKQMGYEIKIDTNGLRPEVLEDLLKKNLVDYLAMDLKGPLESYDKFCGLKIDPEKIRASIKIIMNSGRPYEFRSTLVKGLHSKRDLTKMAQAIKGAQKYYLQNFNHQNRLVAPAFKGSGFSAKELAAFRQLSLAQVKECYLRGN